MLPALKKKPILSTEETMPMTSKERVLTAFAHQEPDAVPAWCGSSPEFWAKAKDTLGLEQEAGRGEAFGVADRVGLGYQGQIEVRRYEILADALDRPALGGQHFAGLDQVGEHRPDRVGEHHAGFWRDPPEIAAESRQRAARADAGDDRVDIASHLRIDFRARSPLVGRRIGGVAELVGIEGAGRRFGQTFCPIVVIVRVALAHVRAGDIDFRTERTQVQDLFPGHLVRHDEVDPVPLALPDEREAKSGIAGRGLDNRSARTEEAGLFRGLDHRHGNPVLDRSPRVLVLQLEEELAAAGIDLGDLQHRGVADQVQDRVDGWRRAGCAAWVAHSASLLLSDGAGR